jgi:hypothetical protein
LNATLKFAFEKETKGAVRYQEVGDDGAPVPYKSAVPDLQINILRLPRVAVKVDRTAALIPFLHSC